MYYKNPLRVLLIFVGASYTIKAAGLRRNLN